MNRPEPLSALLRSSLPAKSWLQRLPAVSSRLYERDVSAWQQFEPARKTLEESLQHLEYEGEISFEEPASKVLAHLYSSIKNSEKAWPLRPPQQRESSGAQN